MDKSVDSIGSCSLDVDADSSDISDTSGSLNFPTPISIKDVTQEFTANIHERCTVRKVHMQTISNQPTSTVTSPSALRQAAENEKKPSYLNLACCVNGYSNITTYDSKIRQDINKSREVSPIRPSSSSIQYCKKNDCLAPPSLQTMPNTSINGSNVNPTSTSKFTYCQENGHQNMSNEQHHEGRQRSFIQQRVERLYGPGALAQGFYSPKKVRDSVRTPSLDQERDLETSELTMKFKQLSPSKDYGEFRKKINGTETQSPRLVLDSNIDNNSIDLPVLRHLSHEFRAQLPKISPKRNVLRSPPSENSCPNTVINAKEIVQKLEQTDEVDHKNLSLDSISSIEINTTSRPDLTNNLNSNTKPLHVETTPSIVSKSNTSHVLVPQTQNSEHLKKDGNYFLKLLKSEQDRLLSLACDAEKNIELLSGQPEITEEIFGLLRSASGKARLLASQKMKQFEGLCHKNLNDIPGQKFPTTSDDLQGFWDMVNLQVDHIDSIFADLEVLKRNNWKKNEEVVPVTSPRKQKQISRPSNLKASSVSNGNGTKSQATMSAAALKRESQRKQLMEMKRKNRMALAASASEVDNRANELDTSEKNSIEISINENQS